MTVIDDRTNFEKMNTIGKIGEEKYIELLQKKGCTLLERSTGYAPDFDIKYVTSKGKELTVEVKTCTSRYPNVAVEVWSRNKVSGICSTKADYYAVYNTHDNTFYIAPRLELKLFMCVSKQIKYKRNRQNTSGTALYTIPKTVWQEHFLVEAM